jgi:hypothetical protein
MSGAPPTIPTAVARRPRAHRTQANYALARRMEAMLSAATSYRGAHVRRKPTPTASTHDENIGDNNDDTTAGHGDGEAFDEEEEGGEVEVGEVHVGMDGVEGVELVTTPQRRRRQPPQPQQQQQEQVPTEEEEEEEEEWELSEDGRGSGPADGGGGGSGDDGESGGGGDGGGTPYESERRRFEHDRQLRYDRERERNQLFLAEHRLARRGGVHLDDDHDDADAAGDARLYSDDEYDYDDDAQLHDYTYDGRAGYVEQQRPRPRAHSNNSNSLSRPSSSRDRNQPPNYHQYVNPDDEVAMATLAGELERRGVSYPYEDDGSIAHLRALVQGGPHTPPPPIPEVRHFSPRQL